MPLSPEDQIHVTAAEGYLGLGMFCDAEAELERVDPHLPEVLVVRLSLYQESKRWSAMQTVARKLIDLDPADPQLAIALAYATRRAESIDLARLILMEALNRHPLEPLIHYTWPATTASLGTCLRPRSSSQEPCI